MKTQKTWIDLLGRSSRNCIVDGRYISRRIAPDHYQVIMAFESHEMAMDVWDAWMLEIAAKKKADDDFVNAHEIMEYRRLGYR